MGLIYEVLSEAIKENASDIHLTKNLLPTLRINGRLIQLSSYEVMTDELLAKQLDCLLTDSMKERYKKEKQIDFSLKHDEYRFRVHIYTQNGSDTFALRLIPLVIPKMGDLKLPPVIGDFLTLKNGLILVTGVTGSGKSTTLAAMIDNINRSQNKLIITVEDPVEFVHAHNKCIVNQREVGHDVLSFNDAVRAAMREDPDVLMLGEMRDLETISNAITMAETGHLVFATLHTKSVAETVDRIIDVFPPNQQQQVRIQLSNVLQGVISQQLLPKSGGGRVPACEVMVVTDAIRSLIKEHGSPNSIIDQIQMNHRKLGCQTIYQSLASLYSEKLIDLNTAMENVENQEILKRMIAGS